MARQAWQYLSVGYAGQTDLKTENSTDGDFTYFQTEVNIPDYTRQMFNLNIATGQVGAKFAPMAGSKRAKIVFKMPLFGFVNNYDPETKEPGVTASVVHAAQVLLGLILGSNSSSASTAADLAKGVGLSIADLTSTYAATFADAEIASVPSTTSADVGTGHGNRWKAGQFFAGDTAKASGSPFLTWIKNISTDTLNFADAPGNQPQVGDDIWATVVAYVSGDQPKPITIRLLGNNAAFKSVLVGAIPTGLKFTGKSGEPPMIEVTLEAPGHLAYSTGGGLQGLTITPKMPTPCVGIGGGRFTLAADGSALAAQDGIRDFSIEIANKISDIKSHNSPSGISERLVIDRDIKIKWLHPRSSSDTIAAGDGPWDAVLKAATQYKAALYSGDLPGRLFSVFMPAMYLVDLKPVVQDGLVYDDLTWTPAPYVADGSSTNAGNSPLRFGFA